MSVLRKRSRTTMTRALVGLSATALMTTACTGGGTTPSTSAAPTPSPNPPTSTPATVEKCNADSMSWSNTYPNQPTNGEPVIRAEAIFNVSHDCSSRDWDITISVAGGPAQPVNHTGDQDPNELYVAGKEVDVRLQWDGMGDLKDVKHAILTINGSPFPMRIRGWTGNPVTWTGPIDLSTATTSGELPTE